MDEARSALAEAVRRQGGSLLQLSRWLGRNDAYLHQFVTRGTPRRLAEADRQRLAALLGVSEEALGGPPAPPAMVAVPRLDLGASAGPGRVVEAARAVPLQLAPALLRALHVRPAAASLIRVEGESMAPGLTDGDEVLVDTDRRRPNARGAVYVLRLDGDLMIKRVAAAPGGWRITSDNPESPSPGLVASDRIALIGKVVWLMRAI